MTANIRGINCPNCRHVLYIQQGRQGSVPPSQFPTISYCPVCSLPAHQFTSLDDAWWQEMAYYYGLPIDTIKSLYKESNWNDTHKTFDSWFKQNVQKALQLQTQTQKAL